MKSLKNSFIKRILIHAFIGGLIGLFFFHPLSMVVNDFDEQGIIHFVDIKRVFSVSHAVMTLYYIVIGIVFGVIIAFYVQRLVKMHEKLYLISNTDELTGLMNRRGFFSFGEKILKKAVRNNDKIMLLFADLDNLKLINDSFGHEEGDRALINAADIINKTFRDSDIIARIGGDEFAVLMTENHETKFEIINSRLHENISNLNKLYHGRHKLSISTGMAKNDSERPYSMDELLKLADAVMYSNKNKKKISSLTYEQTGIR